MSVDTDYWFPHLQNLSQEFQLLEEFCRSEKPNASLNNLIQTSNVSDYDLVGEGDLFKAPASIIEEPVFGLDPMTVAVSMISCGDEVISPQGLDVSDIESIQKEQLLSEFYYECTRDLSENSAVCNILDKAFPVTRVDEDKSACEGALQKSVSAGSLNAMEWVNEVASKTNFLDFSGIDFGAAYGMRRAFSEGDITALGNSHASIVHSPCERPLMISNCTSEERREKLIRYRNKKTKRNFGRKIKYACRKALADSQPRIRGRFAKTDDSEVSKKSNYL